MSAGQSVHWAGVWGRHGGGWPGDLTWWWTCGSRVSLGPWRLTLAGPGRVSLVLSPAQLSRGRGPAGQWVRWGDLGSARTVSARQPCPHPEAPLGTRRPTRPRLQLSLHSASLSSVASERRLGWRGRWPLLPQAQGPVSLYPEPGSPWDTMHLVKAWMSDPGSEGVWQED